MPSSPLTSDRTADGRVCVTLDRGSISSRSVLITPAQARALAAELLVAASEEASHAASNVGDAIEIAQTGRELFSHMQRMAKKNGWVR